MEELYLFHENDMKNLDNWHLYRLKLDTVPSGLSISKKPSLTTDISESFDLNVHSQSQN